MAKQTKPQERAAQLYDFAVAHPEGFTNQQAMDKFGWNLKQFNEASRTLRLIFGDADSINLVCDPQGEGQDWLYRLVGTYSEANGWTAIRLQDTETRLETIEAVSHSIVSATDGRSTDGRKARLIHSTMRYLREQLGILTGHSPS